MRIAVVSLGSRGDVQPYVALGAGLARAGHDVSIATHDVFRGWIEGLGLGFAPVTGNPRDMLESDRTWLDAGRNPVAFMRGLVETGLALLPAMQRDCWRACQGADALVFGLLGTMCVSIGERLGIPAIPAFVMPMGRTREYPSPIVDAPGLPAWLNALSHRAVEQGFWLPTRGLVNDFRRELGLTPFGLFGPYDAWFEKTDPMLFGYSAHVVPRPRDWGPNLAVTGYWFLDHPPDWRPPADLAAFLAAGPPPVYVGFGSMTPRDPGTLAEKAIAALRRAGARGVLLAGWGGLGRSDGDDDVLVVENVPHDWLFPRMGAIVHHGGAGTTAAALRSGVPSLVVPFFADQPFWGRRVATLGAGPPPIPHGALTAERLGEAIATMLGDAAMRDRARAIGDAIAAEDGVGKAVGLINRALTGRV
ncbi:MAG: glycosyltransferase family 1 protein [Candidatus Sericytochromatia bacterium]|nr:glycosyltransferase family 1 protein [Candidatus Tanganyikabacteria bacterium]